MRVYCWKCGREVSRRHGGKLYKHTMPGTTATCVVSGTKPRNCRAVTSAVALNNMRHDGMSSSYDSVLRGWHWVDSTGNRVGFSEPSAQYTGLTAADTLNASDLDAALIALRNMQEENESDVVAYWERWARRRTLTQLRASVNNFPDDVTTETASVSQLAVTQELLRREGV